MVVVLKKLGENKHAFEKMTEWFKVIDCKSIGLYPS